MRSPKSQRIFVITRIIYDTLDVNKIDDSSSSDSEKRSDKHLRKRRVLSSSKSSVSSESSRDRKHSRKGKTEHISRSKREDERDNDRRYT
jgi:hypothetical protein